MMNLLYGSISFVNENIFVNIQQKYERSKRGCKLANPQAIYQRKIEKKTKKRENVRRGWVRKKRQRLAPRDWSAGSSVGKHEPRKPPKSRRLPAQTVPRWKFFSYVFHSKAAFMYFSEVCVLKEEKIWWKLYIQQIKILLSMHKFRSERFIDS